MIIGNLTLTNKMKIHGKELESHDYGRIIYYDNKLIRSEIQKINTHTDFEYWKKRIEENPDFCACKAGGFFERCPMFVCKKEYCDNGL